MGWEWVAGVVVVLWGQRHWRAIRAEQRFARRFPRGVDGVIIGAEPREFAGSSERALLLFHGYNDSPQSLAAVGELIAREGGWTVRLPLLAGHGRTLREFDAWTPEEVLDAARAEYAALRARFPTVAIGGLSMGGAIAMILAAEVSASAVVLYAPMLFEPRPMRWVRWTSGLWSLFSRYVSGGGSRSIHDPEAMRSIIAYGASTRRSVLTLDRIGNACEAALATVEEPVLVVQSREDNRLPMEQSERAFARIGSKDMSVRWITGAGHVITVDYGWQEIARETVAWLDARLRTR